MNVLIVEDNPISSKVLEHALETHGYVTLTAGDGEQALEHLEFHPEIQLIITDLVMPKTNGIELVRKIKERPEWSDIPILVCTGTVHEQTLCRIADLGCKYYVVKPIREALLLQTVKEAVSKQRLVLRDPNQLRSEMGMDSQVFLAILDEFSRVIKDKITRFERQIEEAPDTPLDLQDLLEGATFFGAERVTDVMNRLIEDGKKPEVTRSTYPLLLRELKALHHTFTAFSSTNTSCFFTDATALG